MKQIIYTVLFLVAIGLTGCQKAEYLLFNDIARVQMDEANEILTSFYYMDAAIGRDTVYLTVNTIGDPENRVRQIALEQISEYDVEYKYDEKGNLIDSILTEKPNKAVAGTLCTDGRPGNASPVGYSAECCNGRNPCHFVAGCQFERRRLSPVPSVESH